jgi:type I restriction enzyme S subunit
VDKKSVEGERAVRLCNYVDVYKNDRISADMEFMDATATDAQIEQFSIHAGDVIITKDSETWDDIAVPAHVPQAIEGLVCGYHLALIRPDARCLDGSYLARCFAAEGLCDQFRVAANGITRYGLDTQSIKSAVFPVPPLPEQRAIAAFLDRETARIDTLIGHKERLIALLEEKRDAVICHAVTRGLDPNATLKDSGVPWLGMVPKHWTITRLGRVIKLQRGFDITGAAEITDGYPVYSSGGLSGRAECAMVAGPGVIVGRKGTLGTVHFSEGNYWPHDTTLFVKEFRGSDPRFVYYYLRHMRLESFDVGSANPTLNRNHVHPVPVAWPDVDTQRKIALYLDDLFSRLTPLEIRIRDGIARLQEYRTALISAAVTGQIYVRGEVPT